MGKLFCRKERVAEEKGLLSYTTHRSSIRTSIAIDREDAAEIEVEVVCDGSA